MTDRRKTGTNAHFLRGTLWIAVVVLAFLAALVLASRAVTHVAARKAEAIMETLVGPTAEDTVVNVARWAAADFDTKAALPGYFRFAFLADHRYMPEILRIPRGALDVFYLRGPCNSLSRTLEFLFSTAGLEAVQHDLIGPRDAHSAVSVMLDGEWIYIDPFFGVVFMEDGRLISLERLRTLVVAGHRPHDFAVALKERPKMAIYDTLAELFHGRMGEPIEVEIRLPLGESRLGVGRPDGRWQDVRDMGGRQGVSTHLHYVGPRYGRNFAFHFTADRKHAPSGFRIVYHLTEPAEPDNLPRSNVPAELAGDTLAYEARDPGEGIRLDYGAMRWTLRSLLKRRSWYNVDMFEATAL